MNKPKLNQPDVEQSTTLEPNGAYGTPESNYFEKPISLSIPINQTIEEVKKEWEEAGYEVEYLNKRFEAKKCWVEKYCNDLHHTFSKIVIEKDFLYITGQFSNKQIKLLTKTFRALGREV